MSYRPLLLLKWTWEMIPQKRLMWSSLRNSLAFLQADFLPSVTCLQILHHRIMGHVAREEVQDRESIDGSNSGCCIRCGGLALSIL